VPQARCLVQVLFLHPHNGPIVLEDSGGVLRLQLAQPLYAREQLWLTAVQIGEALLAERARLPGHRGGQHGGHRGGRIRPPERDALISELRAHNDTLRGQLEAERQAHAEARRIIAGLVERIPAIEASAETPEAYEAAEEASGRVESQEGAQRRPWWKKVFRG
jgi:hypothetical protein